MANESGNLFLRNDTIFGVCEGLGRDLRINPNFLRVPLAAGIIFAPLMTVGIYLALGLVVLASRMFFPDRRTIVPAPVQEQPVLAQVAVEAEEPVMAEQPRILEAA